MSIDKNRNIGYDLIRFTAISFVIISHFAAKYLSICGLWGVELFFVLSGFLIGKIIIIKIYQNEDCSFKNLKNFWLRRWFRTIPNYFLFLILYTSTNIINKDLIDLREWQKYVWFGQNLAWPIGSFFGVSWSLAVEEWFYLIFPLVLWLCLKVAKSYKVHIHDSKVLFFCIISIYMIIPLILRINSIGNGNWDAWHRKIVIMRLDAMMYGVLAAAISNWYDKLWSILASYYFFILGLILITIGTFLLLTSTLSSLSTALAFTIISLGCSTFLAPIENIRISSKSTSIIIQKISIYSYSMYLSHMLIFEFIEKFMHPYNIVVELKIFQRFISLIIIYLISSLIYKYYELPITNIRENIT